MFQRNETTGKSTHTTTYNCRVLPATAPLTEAYDFETNLNQLHVYANTAATTGKNNRVMKLVQV